MFLLLLVSITLMASGKLKDAAVKDRASQLSVINFSADDIRSNKENAGAFYSEAVALPGIDDIIAGVVSVDKEQVIGGILIPDAQINLPIFQGITRENLAVGAGTLKEDQQMGTGNYGLAGHHMKDRSLLFGPILTLEQGSLIYLTDLERVYIYEVTTTKRIHEEEVEVLEDGEEPQVTLITCDISGVNTDYRRMVQGRLVKEISATEADHANEYQKYLQYIEKEMSHMKNNILLWSVGIIIGSLILTKATQVFINR